ncbi:MAG: hypothetical protein HFF90_12390 [Oscillibacter sp.]|nr:hypothetical protein [Oscillibacter sp.]
MHEEDRTNYAYWKRPWHKWIVFAAALIQLWPLWQNIREYHSISNMGILSASEWTTYALQKNWQCALNGFLFTMLLGCFLIGFFVRTQRESNLANGLLLLLLSLAWGAAGIVLHLLSSPGKALQWSFILLIGLGGAVYSLSSYRKNH